MSQPEEKDQCKECKNEATWECVTCQYLLCDVHTEELDHPDGDQCDTCLYEESEESEEEEEEQQPPCHRNDCQDEIDAEDPPCTECKERFCVAHLRLCSVAECHYALCVDCAPADDQEQRVCDKCCEVFCGEHFAGAMCYECGRDETQEVGTQTEEPKIPEKKKRERVKVTRPTCASKRPLPQGDAPVYLDPLDQEIPEELEKVAREQYQVKLHRRGPALDGPFEVHVTKLDAPPPKINFKEFHLNLLLDPAMWEARLVKEFSCGRTFHVEKARKNKKRRTE